MTIPTLFGPVEIDVDDQGLVTKAPAIYGWWVGKQARDFEAAVALLSKRTEVPRRRPPSVAAELLYKQGRLL